MVDENRVVFDSEVFLTVLVDAYENGFVAMVEDVVSGSETNWASETFGELMNSVLTWAGVSGIKFDMNDSLDAIRESLDDIGENAFKNGEENFQVKIYTSF